VPHPAADLPSRLTDQVRLALARQRALVGGSTPSAKPKRQRSAALRGAIRSAAKK
jgi:hypothetical protein